MARSRSGLRACRAAATAILMTGAMVASGGAVAHAVEKAPECVINVDTGGYTCDQTTVARWTVGAVQLAELYKGPNYTGGSLRYFSPSGRDCDTDRSTVEWSDSSFDDPQWNNEFESVKTYGNCRIKLFRWTNFGGGSTTWINEWANFNTGDNWANNVSSVKIS